jgi:hypothetical protein
MLSVSVVYRGIAILFVRSNKSTDKRQLTVVRGNSDLIHETSKEHLHLTEVF